MVRRDEFGTCVLLGKWLLTLVVANAVCFFLFLFFFFESLLCEKLWKIK